MQVISSLFLFIFMKLIVILNNKIYPSKVVLVGWNFCTVFFTLYNKTLWENNMKRISNSLGFPGWRLGITSYRMQYRQSSRWRCTLSAAASERRSEEKYLPVKSERALLKAAKVGTRHDEDLDVRTHFQVSNECFFIYSYIVCQTY